MEAVPQPSTVAFHSRKEGGKEPSTVGKREGRRGEGGPPLSLLPPPLPSPPAGMEGGGRVEAVAREAEERAAEERAVE